MRVIVIAMLAMLALPLPLGVLAGYGPAAFRTALATAPLYGEIAVVVPPFDAAEPGPFQAAVAEWFARLLFPRGPVVRLTNQFYYDVFARSHAYSNAIIVGRGETLFERAYIENYCAPDLANDEQRLHDLVASLVTLDREMKRRGVPFVFLLTPSKAATLPREMPPGSCGRQKARHRTVEVFARALEAASVSFVDGVALTRAYRKKDPLPPFPRGGTHWSLAVGDRVTKQVLAQLGRSSGQNLGKVSLHNWRWDRSPDGSDTDLALLANLATPPLDYPTGRAEVRCRLGPAGMGMDLIVVGGSFSSAVSSLLSECAFFSATHLNFYYRERLGADGWRSLLARPSALVVELNETSLTWQTPSGWLDPFFADILSAVKAAAD